MVDTMNTDMIGPLVDLGKTARLPQGLSARLTEAVTATPDRGNIVVVNDPDGLVTVRISQAVRETGKRIRVVSVVEGIRPKDAYVVADEMQEHRSDTAMLVMADGEVVRSLFRPGTVDGVFVHPYLGNWRTVERVAAWWHNVRVGGWMLGLGLNSSTEFDRAIEHYFGTPDLALPSSPGIWAVHKKNK